MEKSCRECGESYEINVHLNDGFCDDCREHLNRKSFTSDSQQVISLEEMDKLWEEGDNEEMYELSVLLEQALQCDSSRLIPYTEAMSKKARSLISGVEVDECFIELRRIEYADH